MSFPFTTRLTGTLGNLGIAIFGTGFCGLFSSTAYLEPLLGTSPSRITRFGGTVGS